MMGGQQVKRQRMREVTAGGKTRQWEEEESKREQKQAG